MMSYAERDLPDLIENIKRLEAECESWRKQFRECAVELASAERENAKLRAALRAIIRECETVMPNSGHMYLGIINEVHAKSKEALETTNG